MAADRLERKAKRERERVKDRKEVNKRDSFTEIQEN